MIYIAARFSESVPSIIIIPGIHFSEMAFQRPPNTFPPTHWHSCTSYQSRFDTITTITLREREICPVSMMIGLLCVIVLRADDCVHFSVLLFDRHCNVWVSNIGPLVANTVSKSWGDSILFTSSTSLHGNMAETRAPVISLTQ